MMKNLRFYLVALMMLNFYFGNAQKHHHDHHHPIAEQLDKHQSVLDQIKPKELLVIASDQGMRSVSLADEVSEASFFKLKKSEVSEVIQNRPSLMNINLPTIGRAPFRLDLYQANIFSPEFKVVTSSNRDTAFPYESGVYYWGTVDGDEESLAAITVTEDEVSGFIFSDGEMYTLGKLNEDVEGTHILFKESDLKISSPMSCGTDSELHFKGKEGTSASTIRGPENCVRMYIEVDYDIFVGKGGVQQAADYVNAAFAQVAILYANESISFTVNEILVWDTVDPYTGPSTSNYLSQFRTELGGSFNGDLAHLVGYQGSGGIAYVDVVCNSSYGIGYSDINASFATVPTYSWTIEVLTHEIGHNLGSRHTHDCVWNGNGTAIDRCGPQAGYSADCNPPAPLPSSGTIMSYCHLVGGVGIDFNLGFGPQPGDLIRDRVYNAPCLTSCAAPTTDDAGVTVIVSPNGTTCENSLSPQVELTNFGTATLTSVTIEYGVDGGSNNFSWAGNLTAGSSTLVTLPSVSFSTGTHTFDASTINPNGNADKILPMMEALPISLDLSTKLGMLTLMEMVLETQTIPLCLAINQQAM